MADGKTTDVTIASARDAAQELLSAAFDELRRSKEVQPGEGPRFFFPNGIELISITLSVSSLSVTFKIAGQKGISGLLGSGEIGGGPTGKVAQEVTEEQ